jgi:hypothetical protein
MQLHANRGKPEDFKHYYPSMRYRDDSPDNVQRLTGLEKENVNRNARQETYNQMLLNNLERLADRKRESRDHDRFVNDLLQQQSPSSYASRINPVRRAEYDQKMGTLEPRSRSRSGRDSEEPRLA